MKHYFACILLAICLRAAEKPAKQQSTCAPVSSTSNLFIVTIDGLRWQEVFSGADSILISREKFTPDTSTMKSLYWAASGNERRRRLMPFFWNVLAAKGQLYGNRLFKNKVNSTNLYSISYAGYSEMFAGHADISIASNSKRSNPNFNVLEYLNQKNGYAGKVVAFTSWDVFPFILNRKRSNLKINSGYENMGEIDGQESLVNMVANAVSNKTETRHDELTFITAKEYMNKFKPAIVYIAFGETDEAAHVGRYDLYLEKAAQLDRMLAELWHWVQSTPGYANNTTLLVTTDHGRGKGAKWTDHGIFVNGSSQTWLGVIGPRIKALGEIKEEGQVYEKQIAQTIASLAGEYFTSEQNVAAAIPLR